MSNKYNFTNNHLGVIRESDGQYISFADADPNKPWLDEQMAKGNLPGPMHQQHLNELSDAAKDRSA